MIRDSGGFLLENSNRTHCEDADRLSSIHRMDSLFTNYTNTVNEEVFGPDDATKVSDSNQTNQTRDLLEKIDNLRRTNEKKRVVEENRILRELNQKEDRPSTDPKKLYVFDAKWIDNYKKYLESATNIPLPPPRQVDNRPIERKILADALTDDDFYTVSEQMAKFIFLLYRGGPVISQQNIEELKKEAEVRRSGYLPTPSKSSRDEVGSMGKFSALSEESQASSNYSRQMKTKSDLEKRFANSKGYVESQKDPLEDSSSLYNMKHRGDSPTESMDEEEENLKKSLEKHKRPKERTDSMVSNEGTINSEVAPVKQSSELLKYKENLDLFKRTLRAFSEKHKKFGSKNTIDFDKSHKRHIHSKTVELLQYIQSVNLHEPVSPLEKKYKVLLPLPLSINCNGLENEHVFCYLNSLMQLLLSIKELVIYFLRSPEVTSSTKCSYQLKKFMEIYQNKNLSLLDATPLLSLFKTKIDIHEQQDVDEVLRMLFDMVQRELKPRTKAKPAYTKPDWSSFCESEDSILTYLFAGETQRTTVCFNCHHTSWISETFDVLSLSIPSKPTDLNAVVETNYGPELIEDNFMCSGCSYRVPATSRLLFSQLPRYLFIQLKRFSIFPKPCKSTTLVEYSDGDKLHLRRYSLLTSFSLLTSGTSYKLIGAVHHHGSITNGHYRVSCLRSGKVAADHPVAAVR